MITTTLATERNDDMQRAVAHQGPREHGTDIWQLKAPADGTMAGQCETFGTAMVDIRNMGTIKDHNVNDMGAMATRWRSIHAAEVCHGSLVPCLM